MPAGAAPEAGDLPATASAAASPASSAEAAAAKLAEVPAAAAVPAIGPELDSQIGAIIAANGAYALGVSLIDVSDGVVHGYGVQSKFVAASTAKILAASAYYHLVETGRASLTSRLGVSTAGAQIRQMVQQSNNDSWALILGAVGAAGHYRLCRVDRDHLRPVGEPADPRGDGPDASAALHRAAAQPQHTAQLLSYMQNTNYETLIPSAVPPGIGIYHKYGLLFGNLHDASVLVKDGRAFVFVVYTRGKNYSDMGPRTLIIQQLTRAVTAALF